MLDLPLFTQPLARSRKLDPETSAEAAERVERNGTAAGQRQNVLAAVNTHPGMTSAEIAELLGMERHAPARRLPELRDAGLLRMGEKRKCTVAGTMAMTWEPIDD